RIADANGCTGYSDTVHISVHPKPPLSVSGPVVICNGSKAQYSTTSKTGLKYDWKVTGAGATITSGSGSNLIEVQWGSASGTVSIVVSDPATGCISKGMLAVTIGNNLVPAISANRST